MMNKTLRRWYNCFLAALAAMQVLLVLLSWLVTAAAPELPVRSLLSSEGIRWLFGHFTENMQTPLLVWLILVLMAGGVVRDSGLCDTLRHGLSSLIRSDRRGDRETADMPSQRLSYRERLSVSVVAAEVCLFVLVVGLLAVMRRDIMLSVTGDLWPSTFSRSIIPVGALLVTVCALSAGLLTGKIVGPAAVCHCLSSGLRRGAWVFPLYVLAVQLWCSCLFVFTAG